MSTEATTTTTTAPNRNDIRSKILGKTHKPASRLVDFFGTQIELRQPKLGEILEVQQMEDREAAVITMLIQRAYVPGTDELVFEDADADSLKELPFGKEFVHINEVLAELSDVDFLDGANT